MRCEIPHRCVRRKCSIRRSSASSLTDSLRSVVRLRRAVRAYEWGGNFLVDTRKKLNGEAIRPRQSRFSIGSAPLTSITKIDAQVRGGETRQDYKDTRRFPLEAPSCALLFRPCRLPDTCPPFSLREAWRFLIAHAVGISVRCRSFAPSWAVCTNPPFSPTAAPYPVTIVLSPTRKDTQKRHWQQPLVSGLRSREACTSIHRVLEVLT